MNYKEKLIKQSEHYEIKRRAILDTIRSLEVIKDNSEPINWDEVDNDKVQQDTIDYLIDAKLQNLLNDSLPVEAIVSKGVPQPCAVAEKPRIEGLFYFPEEKILCLVAGYTDNSDSVDSWIETFTEYKNYILSIVETDEVKTTYITQSRRYKYMRVFYCNVENAPEDAYGIQGSGWTMMKWLRD